MHFILFAAIKIEREIKNIIQDTFYLLVLVSEPRILFSYRSLWTK